MSNAPFELITETFYDGKKLFRSCPKALKLLDVFTCSFMEAFSAPRSRRNL